MEYNSPEAFLRSLVCRVCKLFRVVLFGCALRNSKLYKLYSKVHKYLHVGLLGISMVTIRMTSFMVLISVRITTHEPSSRNLDIFIPTPTTRSLQCNVGSCIASNTKLESMNQDS